MLSTYDTAIGGISSYHAARLVSLCHLKPCRCFLIHLLIQVRLTDDERASCLLFRVFQGMIIFGDFFEYSLVILALIHAYQGFQLSFRSILCHVLGI